MLEVTLERFQFAEPDLAADEIMDLVEAVFGPVESDIRFAWSIAEEAELAQSLVAGLLRRAKLSDDPLAELASAPLLRTRLNTLMRQRWAFRKLQAAGYPEELCGLEWIDLDAASRDMVRDGIEHLETVALLPRRRGPHQDYRLDTFLNELAEIYARHTGSTAHQLEVPSTETSRFIKLAAQILEPLIKPKPMELPATIAQRWKRYKRAHRRGQCD